MQNYSFEIERNFRFIQQENTIEELSNCPICLGLNSIIFLSKKIITKNFFMKKK